MAIALNTVIVDGQEYKPGDVIPDFKSIKCVDTREPRKYQGLSADVSVLNDVIAKYASGGASCFMSDTGEYYEYDRKEKAWKLITNITERGFDSEKAYGALKHMLKNVTVSDEKIQSAVTNYLTVNPVLPGATTEQAQQIEQNKTDVASLKTETSSLKEDLGSVIELSENLISLSEESAVVIENVTPILEFPNIGSVKITQPSRANVKIAFPINVPDDTDLISEYAISIKSDVVLNSLARAMIVVDASTSSQGTAIKPVLQQSEDYSTWSATGSFDNVKKKYVYIMLPYNIPSATFEISVQKNIDKTIKLSALKNIGDNNFDSKTKKRLKTVDYLEKEVGEDLSQKTLIVLNFEYPTGAGDIFYDARQALLESYGFKGSFALTEELNDNQVTRLHNLVNNGHDISIYNQSTTGRPDDVDNVSKQAEWNKYIKDIIDLANAYGVRNPVGYHCKYNKIGKALYNALLTNGFKVARCTNGVSAGLIPGEIEDSKYIKSFDKIMTVVDTAGMASSSTSGGYIYWIKQCIQNGWDFSLFGHAMEDVDENTAVSDSVNFKKYVYVEILDYIKQCVDDGTVAVVTWKDFYDIRSKA